MPELLGGYRLRIGGFYIDASLKGQVEKMTSDLETAVLASEK
jgi:F0F1-type ATP synthase delta subunit